MCSPAGPFLSGQEREKVIQAYRKYRFEWQVKQIYSLCRNYTPRGGQSIRKEFIREVKATRLFLWEMELGVWGESVGMQWKPKVLGLQLNWQKHSLTWPWIPACCSWQRLQSLLPLYSSTPHILRLSVLFCAMWLSFGITVYCCQEREAGRIHPSVPLLSSRFTLPAPCYHSLAKDLLIAL